MTVLDKIHEAKIKGLTEIDLSYSDLTFIPKELFEIRKITSLNLRGNNIEDIPREIFNLVDLKKLDLTNNYLDKLPSDVKYLNNLRVLFLGGNKLTELPTELRYLSYLEELYLTYNQFTQFPKIITNVTSLKSLYIGGNQISTIPEEIVNLNNLRILNLSSNQLGEIPYYVFSLIKLKELYIAKNMVANIPSEIAKLKKLTVLNLSYNQIKFIPEELCCLSELLVLQLNQNQIKEIPYEISYLIKLEILGLSGNVISVIPKEIAFMNKLIKLNIFSNPLKEPPIAIANQGLKYIQNYFISIDGKSTKTLYEAKLVIVGEGDVGKTSLCNKIINTNYKVDINEKPTEGINIKKWSWEWNNNDILSNYTVNIWDFGGQEIYYSTHQFFLTEHTLYLFVWNARKEEIYWSFDYWLNTISSLAKDSPIIIILNKIDILEKEIDQAYYQERFPNIIKFHKVSCKTNEGIDELVRDIMDAVVNMPRIGNVWLEEWTKIRTIIEGLKEDYIDYYDYLRICKDNGLNEEQAKYLSCYLHVLGAILHYQDDYILKSTLILKPDWGTNAIYKLLNQNSIRAKNGKISYRELELLWERWGISKTKHIILLHLMLKYEFCLKLDSVDEYIIPELLPLNRPEYNWDFDDNLCFEYHYDYMPSGILLKFIIRTYQYIENHLFWKTGLIIKNDEGGRALILGEYYCKKVKIFVAGSNKRDFLTVIRNIFGYIHRQLNELSVKEMIPCICDNCRKGKSYFYEYRFLKECMKNGISETTCYYHYKNISIKKLLFGIEDSVHQFMQEDNYSHTYFDSDIYKAFDKSLVSYEKIINKLLEYIENSEDRKLILENMDTIKNQNISLSEKSSAKNKILKFIQDHADKIGTAVSIEGIKHLINMIN